MSREDILFISGDFETFEVPKDKKYLLNYFRTKTQSAFLRYFLMFGSYDHFVDHTGIYCQPRYMKIMLKALNVLESAHAKAKGDMDLEMLADIETGKFSITSLPPC